MGTNLGNQLQQGMQSAEFQAAMQQLAAANPGLAAGLQGLLPGAVAGLTDGLNAVGQGLVDAFRTDTRNMTVGAATLTQLSLWVENHCLQQDYQICRTSG